MRRFNVFGTDMSVMRNNDEWQLYRESMTGIKIRVYDVVIPCELAPEQLAQYLDDIYHEAASARFPRVIEVLPNAEKPC